MKNLTGVFFIFLGVIGIFSTILLIGWLTSFIFFIFDVSIGHPGAIAFVPKWVFLFSFFLVFFSLQPAQKIIEKFF
jgi:hypothetical protein